MPLQEYVDVRILVDGQPLQEYLPPQGDEAEGNSSVRYIQATTGKRFAISMRLLPGYRLLNASNIFRSICLDDSTETLCSPIPRKHLLEYNGTLAQGVAEHYAFKVVTDSQGAVKNADFVFGALEVSESVELSKTLTPDQVKRLGEIKVTVYKGGKESKNRITFPGGMTDVLDAVPEKMMKGRQLLKNNVRFDLSEPPAGYAFEPFSGTPEAGHIGDKAVFVFRYRNKKLLQQLGCIPRSPSPAPDYALMAERQETIIKEAKERQRQANLEILRLRQQIREMDSRTATPEARSVKRERELDDHNDELAEIAPPMKKTLDIVDLTEDD